MAQSEEYATKEDLHRLEDRVDRGFTELRAEMTAARQEHHAEHRAMREEGRAEHQAMREESRAEHQAMREESRAEHQAMREEYRQGIAQVAAGIDKLRRDGIWFGLALAGLLAAIDILA